MLATMDWVSWSNTEWLYSACGYLLPREYKENYYERQEKLVG